MAVRIADTLKQQNNLTTFPVAYGEDIWLDENKGSGTANYDSLQNLYNDGKLGGSSTQVTIMPTASETYLDTVLLYIGETGTYKYGTYYKCVSDGETPPTYSWVDAEIGGGTKIFYADLPIGSWIKNDMATIPSGFLKEGDTISQSEYPELYAKYGPTVPYKADKSELSEYENITLSTNSSNPTVMPYDGVYILANYGVSYIHHIYLNGVEISAGITGNNTTGASMSSTILFKKGDTMYRLNTYIESSTFVEHVAYYKKSLIVKAKHVGIPSDFTDSLKGYLGQETNYNLYSWSHTRTQNGEETTQDIVIERDGWYFIDYTLTNSTDTNHTFTLRDFDSQGEVHTVMRCHHDKSGTLRQTFLVPLKAGTYRYSHGGIGTLSVYMNRRDFAY